MSTFDPSFDHTFRAGLPVTPDVSLFADCLPTGYMLHWLTTVGWCSWLFEGRSVVGQSVRTVGSFSTNRLPRDTQRETTPTYIFRTSGLTRTEADVLATVLQSPAVYWLRESDGSVAAYPIYVAPTDTVIWDEAEKSGQLEIRAILPLTRSLRN